MVMSWPVSSSVRGLRIVLVVDVVGPFGSGGGCDAVEIVSVEGGLERRVVVEIVRLAEDRKGMVVEGRACCWVREAKRVDGVRYCRAPAKRRVEDLEGILLARRHRAQMYGSGVAIVDMYRMMIVPVEMTWRMINAGWSYLAERERLFFWSHM